MAGLDDAQKKVARLAWRTKLLFILCGSVFSLGLLEIGLRLWDASPLSARGRHAAIDFTTRRSSWAMYDPDLQWRMRPSPGEINNEGFRDHPLGEKDQRWRVLVLGDSLTAFGDHIDDTLVAHVRQAAAGFPDIGPTQFINAAVPGYTNYQQLLQLRKVGIGLRPDVVGVIFCLNDLLRISESVVVREGQPAESLGEQAKQKTRDWISNLAGRSRVVQSVRRDIPVLLEELRRARSGGYSFEYSPVLRQAWRDEFWPDIERQISEMRELGRANGFALFLVAVPIRAQLNEDYVERDPAYVRKPQSTLRAICTRLAVPYLDLLPEFDARWFAFDGMHLNAEGRKKVGIKIADFLRREKLLRLRNGLGNPAPSSKSDSRFAGPRKIHERSGLVHVAWPKTPSGP